MQDFKPCDVVGLGTIVIDEQMFLNRIPAEDEKEKATSIRQQVGGPVPTALAMLRRFRRTCHFIGPWGDDLAADIIENDLRSEGITFAAQCRQLGQRSGVAHVWTSSAAGTRTIASHHCDWQEAVLSDIDRRQLRSCRVLHLDGTGGECAIEAASVVRNAGGRIILDAGSPKDATARLLEWAQVVSFPERFAQQFFETNDLAHAGQRIRRLGAEAVICTRGSRGAILFTGDGMTEIPAYSVVPVDSTGAGDVFCGGLIAGLLETDFDAATAVCVGAAAAALKCRQVGNRAALPAPSDIARLIGQGNQTSPDGR